MSSSEQHNQEEPHKAAVKDLERAEGDLARAQTAEAAAEQEVANAVEKLTEIEHDSHRIIRIYVDGEEYETRKHRITPNEIIRDFGRTDPETHYLVQIEHHGNKSFKGKGNEEIDLHNGEKFQIISTGPTPVSDDSKPFGTEAFLHGLRELGFAPTQIPGKADHVVIDYEVPTGKLRGTKVRLGFIVPADFPATTPSGPHVSPHIHPPLQSGAHPTGAIHLEQAKPFQDALEGQWQYWSRPCPDWATSRKTVPIYMSHIWRLWDSQ